jgi:malonyl-CoA O-methyltransferase
MDKALIDKPLLAKRFGRRAVTYDRATPVQAGMASRLVAHASKYLGGRSGLRILELGCGTGRLTKDLLGAFPDARVIAVDISPDMVAYAAQRLPRVRFIADDAEKFVLSCNETFDLVIANAAFQWFQQVEQTLGHVRALLAADGLFAASTFGEDTFTELRQSFRSAYAALGRPAAEHVVNMRPVVWWRGALPHAEIHESRHLREFPDTLSFLRSVQEAGAVNSTTGAHRLRRDVLRMMVKHYESCFATPEGGGVYATYHCLHLCCSGKHLNV